MGDEIQPTDLWETSRAGNPVWQIQGWGLTEEDGYPDLVVLGQELRQQRPPNPEWSARYQYPLRDVSSTEYYAPDPKHLAPRARHLVARAEAKRRTFLGYLANGHTIAEACEHVGISRASYRLWRHKHPDFRNRVERIQAGLPESDEVDETFISRRRYYFGYETFTHHQIIADAVEKTPPGGVTMILLPPESGKTTLVEDWLCDQLALDPNQTILYVSETPTHAAKVLGTLKGRMENDDWQDPDANYPSHITEWVTRYGAFRDDALDKDKPWNSKFIRVHKASGRRDYSFQAVGWKTRVYGSRCKKLILDDVQSDASIGQTETMLRTIRRTFLSRPGEDGQTVIIGTRIGTGDIYERMIEEGLVDELVILPALDEDGNSYWPEMRSPEWLAKKRQQVGEDIWATSYMMAPQEAENSTFTEDLLDLARDPNLIYGVRTPNPLAVTLAAIDPALGGGNAIVVADTTALSLSIVAAQVDYKLARNEDILGKLRALCRFKFSELIVEVNSQQRGLARDDRMREMATMFGFKIVEHDTGKNKWDYNYGVAAMATDFIKGRIRFPDHDERSRRAMEPIRAELLAWRPDVPTKLLRQDLVMALWFLWMVWRKKTKTADQPDTWNVGGTPWKPGQIGGAWDGRMTTVTRDLRPIPAGRIR